MMVLLVVLLLILFVQCLATLRTSPKLGAALLAGLVVGYLAIDSTLRARGATEDEATQYAVYLTAFANVVLFIFRRITGGYGSYNESLLRLPGPTTPGAKELFDKGQQHERASEYDEAIELYEKVLAIEPEFVKCLTTKGILHCMKREHKKGKALFEQAAKLRPDAAYVIHLLAKAEANMGQRKVAFEHYKQAKENLKRERRAKQNA